MLRVDLDTHTGAHEASQNCGGLLECQGVILIVSHDR